MGRISVLAMVTVVVVVVVDESALRQSRIDWIRKYSAHNAILVMFVEQLMPIQSIKAYAPIVLMTNRLAISEIHFLGCSRPVAKSLGRMWSGFGFWSMSRRVAEGVTWWCWSWISRP